MTNKPLNPFKIYLVTGAAGFIGSYLSQRLLTQGCRVIGIDYLNDYYDVDFINSRLDRLQKYHRFTFLNVDIADKKEMNRIFETYHPQIVINLAAQATIQDGIINLNDYIYFNRIGFLNILECCHHSYNEGKVPVEHLIYA